MALGAFQSQMLSVNAIPGLRLAFARTRIVQPCLEVPTPGATASRASATAVRRHRDFIFIASTLQSCLRFASRVPPAPSHGARHRWQLRLMMPNMAPHALDLTYAPFHVAGWTSMASRSAPSAWRLCLRVGVRPLPLVHPARSPPSSPRPVTPASQRAASAQRAGRTHGRCVRCDVSCLHGWVASLRVGEMVPMRLRCG